MQLTLTSAPAVRCYAQTQKASQHVPVFKYSLEIIRPVALMYVRFMPDAAPRE